MSEPNKTLIIDVANVLFRVAAVQKYKNPYAKDSTPEDLVGLCMHISLMSIHKWYHKFHPDFLVFAFEGNNNWRKAYTAEVRSRKAYKGNRTVDPEMLHYYNLVDAFKKTMSAHTSICCLSIDTMEADDAIAGFCQRYARQGAEINIVSGDRDFVQLLRLPGVKLINPDNGKARNQPGDKDYEPDLDYWIFLKCIRGDMGDYVPSAFPKVRETRIKKAYTDAYERANLMNEVWRDEEGVEHRVGDLYEENVILLDLFKQPQEVRAKLEADLFEQVTNIGKYSHFHFLRFLQDYKLNRVRDDAMKFVDMLSNNQIFRSGKKLTASMLPELKDYEIKKESKAAEESPAAQPNKLMEF